MIEMYNICLCHIITTFILRSILRFNPGVPQRLVGDAYGLPPLQCQERHHARLQGRQEPGR